MISQPVSPLVAGVDSSTQSTKVEIRDSDSGERLASGSAQHPMTEPPISEQDPRSWWQALKEAMQQAGVGLAESGRSLKEVEAISVAGQQHGLVLLDEAAQPLRAAKLWNDTTSAAQAEAMVAKLGPQAWVEACGSVPVASFTVTKLAWVAENEPEVLAQTAKVMLPHDYLVWCLCRNHVTDRGDASGTGWFEPASNEYKRELLAEAVADPDSWLERLPKVLSPADTAGELIKPSAEALGLKAGIRVAVGSGDNMGAALGLGLGPGDIAMSLGTSGTVFAVSTEPSRDSSGVVAGFADANGNFLPLVCTLNATKVTDTVAALLGTDQSGLAELAFQADETSELVLVPYFDGERTPNLPLAAGSLFGLRPDSTRSNLARAAFDGVLCGLFEGLEVLSSHAAIDPTQGRLLLIGGGARSFAYRQRCADLRGAEIVVPALDQAVAAGAAVQAATALTGQNPYDIASRWGLADGVIVEPGCDAGEVRQAYRVAAARVIGSYEGDR